MKNVFSLLKEKTHVLKNKKFSFKKFLLLFGAAFIANIFSNFLGITLLVVSSLYLVGKGIVPGIKNLGSKLVNFVKKQYNKIKKLKNKKSKKKAKIFNLFKKKKDQKEEVKTKKKTIPNIIKNFKLFSTDKFKLNLKVKKDVNGCKIVNGSYRMTREDIIDYKTNFSYIRSNIKTKTQEYAEKTYVKTR